MDITAKDLMSDTYLQRSLIDMIVTLDATEDGENATVTGTLELITVTTDAISFRFAGVAEPLTFNAEDLETATIIIRVTVVV